MPPLDRGMVLNRLSNIIGLGSKEINAELSKRVGRLAKTKSSTMEKQKVQSVDYGQGLFAIAQREILEILLNEPKLFESAKQKITAELFNVPILKQIAAILFEKLNTNAAVNLEEILAGVESAELSSVIVRLAQLGEEKGNFQSRLTGALDAVRRYQQQRKKGSIEAIEDQTQFLRRVCENTAKQNPHNLGMT